MEILAAALLALAVFCATLALRPRRTMAGRLAEVGHAPVDRPDALQRVVFPGFRAIAGAARVAVPANFLRGLARSVEEAGRPTDPGIFLALTVLSGVSLGAWMALGASSGDFSARQVLVMAVASAGLGVTGPVVWLRARAKQRRVAVERALPDFLDLVVVSVEAGLGFEGAVARIAEQADGPLAMEFRRVLADENFGATRREALQSLQQRCRAPGIGALVAAILQAEQTGMGVGQVLRAQADRLRVRRRQRAEEAAMKAPVKMLFPMVFFIFPSLFVVVLGPALLALWRSFSG